MVGLNKGKIRKILISIIGTSLIILILNIFGIFPVVRNLFLPIEYKTQNLKVNHLITDEKYESLLDQISESYLLKEENKDLRNLLEFYSENEYSIEIVNVVSYDPLASSLIYIDKGSSSGIQVGNAVVAKDGILVGKIIKTTNSSALVELLTGDSIKLAVSVLHGLETQGILRGHLGTSMNMEFILDDTEFEIGDPVISSGLEARIPRGLIVGIIKQIDFSTDQLFRNAQVVPIIDLKILRILSVIK